MWKTLPSHGAPITEVRVEGSGKGRDVVIVPKAGERLRFPVAGDVVIETSGHVVVRTEAIDQLSIRVTLSGENLVLERAEVAFDEPEAEWQNLWRRARMRSRPWWHESEGELDLDRALPVRLTVAGPAKRAKK